MTIDGLVTPAFIHNGPTFFLVDLPVYSDGLIDCWEMVDLPLLREKIRSGWVTPRVPSGGQISVHGLGTWVASGATWDLDVDTFYARVVELLGILNPKMENLHNCHGRTVERRGKTNVSILGMPKKHPVRIVDPSAVFPKRIEGDDLSVLVSSGAEFCIAKLRAFSDGVIEIGRVPSPQLLDIDALRQAISSGSIVGTLPRGARMRIHGLGAFLVEEEHWCVDPREQLREVSDLLDKLKGRPDSIARCKAAYSAYVADPTHARRDALREAYEAVPEHNRRFVGDMDTKDVAVRMIVYGEQEVENWSHRLVARATGESVLPTIVVPKPKDER
jgi:hypothetical protein